MPKAWSTACSIAEVGGELWAAASVEDLHTVADPFRPTGELVALLTARARQLRRTRPERTPRFARFRPAFG